jgi:L-ribulokinase
MQNHPCAIGVDYGTDSVRALIVDVSSGKEIAAAVHQYARWKKGRYCDPAKNQFRQHPLDYIEGLEKSIKQALGQARRGTAEQVRGISIDTTGSTPVAVDAAGTPLALLPEFASNPNAMFVLWKDHTAVAEAAEINSLAHHGEGVDYTRYCGGIYSSEWFWAKIAHVMRADPKVRRAAFSWVEHCDWVPALLTGLTDPLAIKRSRCAAGHKALWHASWGGLPPESFFVKIDASLAPVRKNLFTETFTADTPVGKLSAAWARRLGLSADVVVGAGAFDAHLGAVGAQIAPYMLTKVMGTSTCDMLVAPRQEIGDQLVRGICGQVDGSIIPGMLGMEAGQSAFGDVYAWFGKLLAWPLESARAGTLDAPSRKKLTKAINDSLIPELSKAAAGLPIDPSGIIALDWMNGRRTPDANQLLKGAIAGLTLGSDAPRIFRSLVEATAFGARKIVDRFRHEGVRIDGIIALGGVAKKSDFVMQTVADVLDMRIQVARSEQACALGSAMCAAVVAGLYPTVEKAQTAMGNGFEGEYRPIVKNAKLYRSLYDRYSALGAFAEGLAQSSAEMLPA